MSTPTATAPHMTGTDAGLVFWILAWGIGLAFFVAHVAAAATGRRGGGQPSVMLAVVVILAAVHGVLSNMATYRDGTLRSFVIAAACAAIVPVVVGRSLGRLRSRRAAADPASAGATRAGAALLDAAHYAAAIALTTAVLAMGSGLGVLR